MWTIMCQQLILLVLGDVAPSIAQNGIRRSQPLRERKNEVTCRAQGEFCESSRDCCDQDAVCEVTNYMQCLLPGRCQPIPIRTCVRKSALKWGPRSLSKEAEPEKCVPLYGQHAGDVCRCCEGTRCKHVASVGQLQVEGFECVVPPLDAPGLSTFCVITSTKGPPLRGDICDCCDQTTCKRAYTLGKYFDCPNCPEVKEFYGFECAPPEVEPVCILHGDQCAIKGSPCCDGLVCSNARCPPLQLGCMECLRPEEAEPEPFCIPKDEPCHPIYGPRCCGRESCLSLRKNRYLYRCTITEWEVEMPWIALKAGTINSQLPPFYHRGGFSLAGPIGPDGKVVFKRPRFITSFRKKAEPIGPPPVCIEMGDTCHPKGGAKCCGEKKCLWIAAGNEYRCTHVRWWGRPQQQAFKAGTYGGQSTYYKGFFLAGPMSSDGKVIFNKDP